MSIQIVRNINISGCAMPMMGMVPMPMMGMGGCCSPIMGGSIFCRPYPYMAMGGAMMAGACIGAALANPGVINALGSVIKPVWNGVLKPVIRAIGNFVEWVWDNTLGWIIKNVGQTKAKKNAEKAAKEAEA